MQLPKEVVSHEGDLIFDMDNTLYDQREFDSGAFEDVADLILTRTKFDKSRITKDQITGYLLENRAVKGSRYRYLFDDLCERFSLPLDLIPEMVESFQNHSGKYIQACRFQADLKSLAKTNRVFVVTNGNTGIQKRKYQQLGISESITEFVVCDGKGKFNYKPDKESFSYLDQKYRLTNALMVGDDADIDGNYAIESGMKYYEYSILNS